ncbi:MAG: Eco57I restriction-modification methylase domain-containing protein [Armatimonadota bacterium]
MAELNIERMRRILKDFDFKTLFIEELGWEHHEQTLTVTAGGETYALRAIAHKRGLIAFTCAPASDGRLPDYKTRRHIEREVAKAVHEHLIIFTDGAHTTQVWQWVKREQGRPIQCREHHYHRSQPGDALIQKLQYLAVSLEEEETLSLVLVTQRVRTAFDVEKVTRRFYERFQSELKAFLQFIRGIPDAEMQTWYASVVINRLMFIYFIQKKGFLNNDPDYLRHSLETSKREGKDRFYRHYLCPLFFEGFGKKENERSPEARQRLGKVPYLDGGLFQTHPIEDQYGKAIQIEDAAFERLFNFFDAYRWHLDERPTRADNEINPDVLGYIFEKYVNQKQMGAYYTKEDITEYISKNTIIPYLFDAAREKCAIAFEEGSAIWRLLQNDPDRYIYDAVKAGVIDDKGNIIPESVLPDFVQKGMHDPRARMFDRRYNLGEADLRDPSGEKLTLPTETWREYVERRKRCLELRDKLSRGEIRDINDFITYNLNIRQFAQDVIENCEGPELLRAFWNAIRTVTILDPTVGSGAFLFAALNVLQPLYEACIDRMEAFVSEADRAGDPDRYPDFRQVLAEMERHPNPRYFIIKSIVVNNLYGVDIMEEATEICKLRLFLKLVAQIDRVEEIEPLPDIDFNIRAGNTLVGYARIEDIGRLWSLVEGPQVHASGRLSFERDHERLRQLVDEYARMLEMFRDQQLDKPVKRQITKHDLKRAHDVVEPELNEDLWRLYRTAGKLAPKTTQKQFLASHKPLHWFLEFPGPMAKGGFDVIIGNPPYVEYSKVKKDYQILGYETEDCGNLYAFVMERNTALAQVRGWSSMIVPHAAFCTDRMEHVQALIARANRAWVSTYCIRPAKLFDGVDQRLGIYLLSYNVVQGHFIASTRYHRWYEPARPYLFTSLRYIDISRIRFPNSLPKIETPIESNIWNKLSNYTPLKHALANFHPCLVYFHNGPRYWIRAMNFVPYFWNERDGEQVSSQIKSLHLGAEIERNVVAAALNSSLFYWWFVILSDCRHLNIREIENFPIGLENMSSSIKEKLVQLMEQLMADMRKHAQRKEAYYKTTGRVVYDEFYPKYSKSIIDEIDQVLARHYGFTDEELDFIINYDIKYRMGQGEEEEEG